MLVTTTATPLRAWLRQYSLFAYFILAFGISWLIELPFALSQYGIGLYTLPSNITVLGIPLVYASGLGIPLGPTGAAFLLTALLEGKPGVRGLLKRYIQWRVSLKWYLLILLGTPLLSTLSFSLFYTPALQNIPIFLWSYLVHLLIAFLINGEEGGWRGFALPRLQKQVGPLLGSILLGLLWGLWHLPLMLIPAQSPLGHPITLALLLVFLLGITARSIWYTWLFNNTGGSLLLAMLLHGALNGYQAGPLFGQVEHEPARLLISVAVALLIIAFTI